jgi:hypothetical protein
MKGHAFWKDKREFLETVQQAKVETLPPPKRISPFPFAVGLKKGIDYWN